MDDKVKELIGLYEQIIHGDSSLMGLLDCLDPYYKESWELQLKQIEELKKDIENENY